MKKLLLLISLSLGLLLAGCVPTDDVVTQNGGATNKNRFFKTGDKYTINSNHHEVVVDRVTNIVYLNLTYYNLTPLIGKDKLPMTYDEYVESK